MTVVFFFFFFMIILSLSFDRIFSCNDLFPRMSILFAFFFLVIWLLTSKQGRSPKLGTKTLNPIPVQYSILDQNFLISIPFPLNYAALKP